MVHGQNAKKSMARQVKEQLILFSLLKPGVGVWRSATYVALNGEEGTAVDPKGELTSSRGAELYFESIPGIALQLAVLIHAKQVKSVAYFALASSVITAGIMSAYMSWDWDIDKEARKHTPAFYGYIPKKSLARKVIIATLLFVCSTCRLLARALICVCLAQKGLGVVAAVLASEMLTFFAAKAFVGDILYWPQIYGIVRYTLFWAPFCGESPRLLDLLRADTAPSRSRRCWILFEFGVHSGHRAHIGY